ncbi:DUF2397 family protein [Nocardiopsis sp. CC223A]|uniref:DUF2397 family protein n=1 Tax=Nocardiopsis sp. CC223A TaxID=3044051 RepID=UPI0027952BA5|nr:DUF2397 family protein [Nocardiopsis sp. CC223A]
MGLNQWADDRADDERSGGERPAPRHGRAALLRLASWFEEAEPGRADALAAAAYALYPARHLKGRVDESVAATTGWWQAEPDRSTVTERPGTRPPEPVRDHRAQQARLRDAAESSAHWRRTGAAQVRALLARPTGPRAHLDLSGAGMEVLMELLTAALGSGDAGRGPTAAGDLEFALRLHVVPAPGSEVVVQGEGGELTLQGLRLCVTPYEQHEIPAELLEPLAPARTPPPGDDAPTPSDDGAPAASGDDTPTPPGGLPLPTPDDDTPTPPHGIPAVPDPRAARRTTAPDAAAPPGARPALHGSPNTAAVPGAHADHATGDPADGGDPGDEADGRSRTATPPGGMAVDPPTAAIPAVREDGDDDDRNTGPIDLGRERPWTRTWG